jgi:hypothetical protein
MAANPPEPVVARGSGRPLWFPEPHGVLCCWIGEFDGSTSRRFRLDGKADLARAVRHRLA